MDKPINVGDLVVVVKPRPQCGCADRLGEIFRVTEIETGEWGAKCLTCFKVEDTTAYFSVAYGGSNSVGIHRLKRIPPLDELEGVSQEQWTTTKWSEPA